MLTYFASQWYVSLQRSLPPLFQFDLQFVATSQSCSICLTEIVISFPAVFFFLGSDTLDTWVVHPWRKGLEFLTVQKAAHINPVLALAECLAWNEVSELKKKKNLLQRLRTSTTFCENCICSCRLDIIFGDVCHPGPPVDILLKRCDYMSGEQHQWLCHSTQCRKNSPFPKHFWGNTACQYKFLLSKVSHTLFCKSVADNSSTSIYSM